MAKTATQQRLDDICEKIDALGERFEKALDRHAADDKEEFKDHDGRIRTIETTIAKVVVIGVVVMAVFSAVAAAAARHFIG